MVNAVVEIKKFVCGITGEDHINELEALSLQIYYGEIERSEVPGLSKYYIPLGLEFHIKIIVYLDALTKPAAIKYLDTLFEKEITDFYMNIVEDITFNELELEITATIIKKIINYAKKLIEKQNSIIL